MKIEMIDINKIKPDEDQPRKEFNPDAIDRLAKSIKKYGVEQHIIIDSGYMIVDGERRYKASKQIKLESIPCIIIDIDEGRKFRQLRTNCLKEELTAWELNQAIFEQYCFLNKTIHNKEKCLSIDTQTDRNICTEISIDIGMSEKRIRDAIDEMKLVERNEEWYLKLKKKEEKKDGGHDSLRATMTHTAKIKDDEARKMVIELSLDMKKNGYVTNDDVKKVTNKVVDIVESRGVIHKVEIQKMLNDMGDAREERRKAEKEKKESKKKNKKKSNTSSPKKEKPDISFIYEECLNNIIDSITDFRIKKLLKYPDHLDFSNLISILEDFILQLKEKKDVKKIS